MSKSLSANGLYRSAIAASMAAALLALSGLGQSAVAGGVPAGALSQRRCVLADTCKLSVPYGAPATAGNRCGVSVVDVVMLLGQVAGVEWRLVPATAGLPAHRFTTAGRVKVDDNNDAPNDGSPVGPTVPVFLNAPLEDAGRVDRKTLDAVGRQRAKVFTYSLTIERERSDGTWEACDPIDPLIVNKG